MARPSEFDRHEAVEIVMNEIWKNGYEASSVKSLSEKLGITRSSFYNAFGSRQNLLKEALKLYFNQSPDIALTNAVPGVSIRQLFTSTFKAACKARGMDQQGRGCLAINCVAELCNVDDELGPVMEHAILSSLKRMETLLNWGVAQKELDPQIDIPGTALALQNLLMGLNIMCKVVRSERDLWKTAQITLKALNLYKE